VSPEGLLAELIDLASDAGLRVRSIGRSAGAEGETGAASGVCVLRGETWVMLASAEPVEARIDVVAAALRENCGDFLEARFLSPALRERLENRT